MVDVVIKATEGKAHKKYDIIAVVPTDWKFGRRECLPNYLIVQMDGKLEDMKYLSEPLVEIVKEEKTYIAPKKHSFDFDKKMTKADLTAIKESKEILLKKVSISDVQEKLSI